MRTDPLFSDGSLLLRPFFAPRFFSFRTARLPVLLYDSFLFLYFSAAGRVSPCGQINDGLSFTIRIRLIRVTQPNVCRAKRGQADSGRLFFACALFSVHTSPFPYTSLCPQPEKPGRQGIFPPPAREMPGSRTGAVHTGRLPPVHLEQNRSFIIYGRKTENHSPGRFG